MPGTTPRAAWSCSSSVACWPSAVGNGPGVAAGDSPSEASGSAIGGTGLQTWSHVSPVRTPNACTPSIRSCALADRNGDPTHEGAAPREPLDLWLASALVDLILDPRASAGAADPVVVSDGVKARRPRIDTVITVTIPVDSLAGLTDAPGVINGFGAIPAADARRLAAGDARWRHVLTCRTTGAVLDVGTLSYRPPAALDRHVRLRDGTCRFPGCAVPAAECDLDHLVPFPLGPTSAENLHALCRRHHGLKHEGGWRVEATPGSGLRWTSPQGASALSRPDDNHARVA